MPGWKSVTIAILSGFGLTLFLALFWRWPLAIGAGLGVLASAVLLLTTVTIGTDPGRADAAWREAAPDLVEPRVGPATDRGSEPEGRPLPEAPDGRAGPNRP